MLLPKRSYSGLTYFIVITVKLLSSLLLAILVEFNDIQQANLVISYLIFI